MKYFRLRHLCLLSFILSINLIFGSQVFASGSIQGKVTLQSRTNHQSLITFKLKDARQPDTVIQTYNVTTSSDGSYAIANIPIGIYNLSAKAPNSLSQNKVLIEVSEGQNTPNIDFYLLGGDANNDNSVAIGDKALLASAWLTKPGDPKWDARADFNGDGSIGIADKAILASNWLKNGTEPRITITSPQDNSFTNTPSITVSGTISDITASVTVNGLTAAVSNNTFTASNIPLTQGQNRISAVAANSIGNKNAALIILTLDQDPPAINIYIPDNNSTTRSSIVYGRVSDDTQTITVNGTPAEILSDFRFIGRPALAEGINTITVQATDKASNKNQKSISITYNTADPKVVITSPVDNSTINISPIKVQGTNTTDLKFILVNAATALIYNTNFSVEGITLDPIKTVITANGYDAGNNQFSDSIVVNSPNLANYELLKVSGDATEDDTDRPSADSSQILKVELDKNNQFAPNEEIQFRITQGQGTLSSQSSLTDINGQAQVTLTTDTNSDITNQVECYPTSNSLVKTTFSIDTKPGQPSILTKITDDSITPVPGATIPITVKLTDSNNNPIQNETINLQITQGTGTLSSLFTVTNYYGEAKVNLTCPNLGLALTQIKASSQTVPAVTVAFNITTSSPLTVTVDDLFNKVEYNAQNIQDQIVEVTVTSNDPYLPSASQYKVWEKGDLLKVQDMSTGEITIRPQLAQGTTSAADIKIISYDPNTNIYVVRTKIANQTDERPYALTYIDYSKGVIVKTESYYETSGFKTMFVTEMKDFVQIPQAGNAWVYNTKVEKMYQEDSTLIYTTTTTVTNQQFNVGLTDADFK